MLGVGLSACAASKSNTGNSSGTAATGASPGTGTGGSGTAAAPTSGASNASDTKPVGTDLTVAFNPMYSGYDGMRTFKLPAIVPGLTGVQWSSSDSSYVSLENDPTTGGVTITTKKAGSVKIIARSGSQSGSADLTINAYNSADCDAGEARYNNMKGIDGGSLISALNANTPKDVSCHSCHGEGAQFLSVQHTPQQTAGWTDDDIANIITKGFKPDGSVLVTMVPPQIYQMFHKWQVTDQEKIGIVCYLRSLEPKTQGMLDFQGLMRPGGAGGTMMAAPH
jgi:hypothetical protein